jgi:hypothetical protein
LSGLFDANSAQAAAQGNYWNAIAGLLGGTMGQAGRQTGGLTPDALTAILPLFTNRPTTR